MMTETPKRILVPLDLSPLGEAKLPVAEAQARAFGAELVLLHVLPPEAVDESGAVSSDEARARTYRGTVEVSRVIGSVGRATTLGSNFRPLKRQRDDEQRYQRVLDGMKNGAAFPPLELYKLGFGYYVLDGNHRVAAAREIGQMEIDAEVTEFVPLGDLEAQRAFAERRAFERATGLTRVEAAHPDSYAHLQAVVDGYGAEQGLGDRREAARRWYGDVWRPMARRIRQLGLTRRFPGDRSADIMVKVAELRDAAAAEGRTLTWPE